MPTTGVPTTQAPIHSGFGTYNYCFREVLESIDLTGKVDTVTGGYAGIDLETRALLQGQEPL